LPRIIMPGALPSPSPIHCHVALFRHRGNITCSYIYNNDVSL
jgi:hypothetical protein